MKVKLQIGKTINIGNYENLRIDVGMEDECEPEKYESKCEELYAKVIEYYNAVYEELKDNV